MANARPVTIRHANTVAAMVMLGYVQIGAARKNGHYVGFFEPHPTLSKDARRYNETFLAVQGMVQGRQANTEHQQRRCG